MVDELLAAQRACHASWELALANSAWQRDKAAEVRFFPRPESAGERGTHSAQAGPERHDPGN
jgi:hypothetical protein